MIIVKISLSVGVFSTLLHILFCRIKFFELFLIYILYYPFLYVILVPIKVMGNGNINMVMSTFLLRVCCFLYVLVIITLI